MPEVNFLVKKGLTVPKGSASTPAVIFDASDSNTGLYSPGADQVAVATNGTQRIEIQADGDVSIDGGTVFIDAGSNRLGVNTSNPAYELEVSSTGEADIQIDSGSGQDAALRFAENGTNAFAIFHDASASALAVYDNTALSQRLTINSAGLVGVGSSSPGYQLEVSSGATDATALFNSTAAQGSHVRFGRSGTVDGYFGCATGFLTSGTSAGDIGIRSQGALVLGSGGNNNRLFITSAGLVGIGDSNPGALLSLKDGNVDNVSGSKLRMNLGPNPYWEIQANNGGTAVTRKLEFFTSSGSGSVLTLLQSGAVGIGTTSPSASSLLDVTSTTQGFLPPRMTTTQRNAISSPAAGLMVYNTTTNKLNFYNGTAWEAVTSA